MPLLIVIIGIILLIVLITVVKLDTFISFVIISIAVGLAEGMKPATLISSEAHWVRWS
jgi:Gnt-I system high-affinity gluconate transporter